MKYDVEYTTRVYITAKGIEASSRDEAIEKADAQLRVSDDWDVNYVTGDNPEYDAIIDAIEHARATSSGKRNEPPYSKATP
jgi:hypothetical protein